MSMYKVLSFERTVAKRETKRDNIRKTIFVRVKDLIITYLLIQQEYRKLS